jgi:hypothetical protein
MKFAHTEPYKKKVSHNNTLVFIISEEHQLSIVKHKYTVEKYRVTER